MSLVQHLNTGELGEWFDRYDAGLRPIARDIAERAEGRHTVTPHGNVGREHYAAVGGIVGQRLADLVEPAPPYAALLGAARCGAIPLAEAGRYATRWPTHANVPAELAGEAAFIRPVHSAGDYWHTMPGASGPAVEPDDAVVGILERAADEAAQRTLGALDPLPVEAGRVPLYYALNLLEGVYRGGHISPELHAISRTGEIRIPPTLVDDVVEVLAHQTRALQQLEGYAVTRGRYDALPAASYGHAAPLLVPNWAEGDLLLGPAHSDGGYTLLDVKTVNRVTPHYVLQWLRQTLAYALLDTAHRWQIARFGLWLPRQSWIVTIPLNEGINALGGRRTEFLRLAKQAIELDGGDPAALLAATP